MDCQNNIDTQREKIKREFAYRNLRLQQIADALGVNVSYVSLVLNGHRPQGGDKAQLILRFGATVSGVDAELWMRDPGMWLSHCARMAKEVA